MCNQAESDWPSFVDGTGSGFPRRGTSDTGHRTGHCGKWKRAAGLCRHSYLEYCLKEVFMCITWLRIWRRQNKRDCSNTFWKCLGGGDLFSISPFPFLWLPRPKFLRNHSCVSCHGGAWCLQVGRWDPVSQERQPVCGQRVKSTVSPGNPDFTVTDPFAKKHKIQNHCKWRDSSLGSSYYPADQNVFWKLHAGTEWIYFWDSEGSMCLEMK